MKLSRIALILALLSLPETSQAAYSGFQVVPPPTAAGQLPVSTASGTSFVYAPVTYCPDGVHWTLGGGTAGTNSVLTTNVVNTADTGVRVNLPSGATGYGYALYSSTGVLLYDVSATGVPSSSRGNYTCEVYGLGASIFLQNYSINTAFGGSAIAGVTSADNNCSAFGGSATAKGGGTALGGSTTALNASVAIGVQASAQGSNSFALGRACATGATHQGSIAIGYQGQTTAAQQMVIGSSTVSGYGITQTYIGDGVTNATPINTAINATGGSGTNTAGANLTLAGGASTGTGAEGTVNIATSGSGATGTTLNALTNRVTVSSSGLSVINGGTVSSSGYFHALRTVATAFTVTSTDDVVLVNGGFNGVLPSAVGLAGREYTIKLINGATSTITTNGGSIDGQTSLTITALNQSRNFVSDGTNWFVFAGYL